MQANLDKTKFMHFRYKATNRTTRLFSFDNEHIEVVSSYKYLGLILNFETTANYVANSVVRLSYFKV